MKKAFTILEMIIVLTIVALLYLLTIPNIQQKKELIETKGCEALIEVINAQILMYELDHMDTPSSIDVLVEGGYIKESQKTCPNGKGIYIKEGDAHCE